MVDRGGMSSGGGSNGAPEPPKTSGKPKYSRFSQQELPACKPILTPGWVIIAFISVGAIFIPIGLATLFASQRVVELVYRYDKDCIPWKYSNDSIGFIQSSTTNKTCMMTFTVSKYMKGPIYVYYQLDNFHQNHRRYATNKMAEQLLSKKYERNTKYCTAEDFTATGQPIVPCGLIAWSLFNDTYKFTLKDEPLEVNKKNIAWKSDREHKFGSDVYPKNFQGGGIIGGAKLNESIPLNQQEDLIVWMRLAALPTFRKPYGKIDADLKPNDQITVAIENNYNIYSFSGKKKLVLSTTSWMGGKNDFLGVAYLTIGGICLFQATGFILVYALKPRPLGDPSYLSWNRNAAGHLG